MFYNDVKVFIFDRTIEQNKLSSLSRPQRVGPSAFT